MEEDNKQTPQSERPAKGIPLLLWDLRNLKIPALCIFLYWLIVRILFGQFCPLRIITGIPCPGCGMTRAALSVLTFHFAQALEYHPLIYFWILWIALELICRYVLGRNLPFRRAWLGILLAVTLGLYFYRMTVVFPGNPPMVYTEDNVLSSWIPGYKELIEHIIQKKSVALLSLQN